MTRSSLLALAISVLVPVAYASDGALQGYFRPVGDKGKGFYEVEAFSGPEFVVRLEPTVNALGSPGFPNKVRVNNPNRDSLGSMLVFSSDGMRPGNEFNTTLYEVECKVPGIPSSFYVSTAGVRQGILADPVGFFYPDLRRQMAAFRESGGVFLSKAPKTSLGEIVAIGPASILVMSDDEALRVSQVPYKNVASDPNLLSSLGELGPFVTRFCAYLAASGSSGAQGGSTPQVGKPFAGVVEGCRVFKRDGLASLATRESGGRVTVAIAADGVSVDQAVVLAGQSEQFSFDDIAALLASAGPAQGWEPAAETAGFPCCWVNSGAGLKAVVNSRRSVFSCKRSL